MCKEEKGCVTINMKCCGSGGEAVVPSVGENGNCLKFYELISRFYSMESYAGLY